MSLKSYAADEIARGLAERLNNVEFTGLYKKAEGTRIVDMPTAWWTKGPTAKAFKDAVDRSKTAQEVDAVQNEYLSGGPKTTALAKEGIDDLTELRNYADKVAGSKTQASDDVECEKHEEPEAGCKVCEDAGTVAVAIDFAIRHMVKLADALDKTGFAGVAGLIDETLQKLASQKPMVVSRSYKGWVSFLTKKDQKSADKFVKTYEKALVEAKKKELKGPKAKEYALETAVNGLKKSLKEPEKVKDAPKGKKK